MTPTAQKWGQPLEGEQAYLASQPISDAVRGGTQTGFDGSTGGPNTERPADRQSLSEAPIEGKGKLLAASDEEAFKAVHNLVLRQELLARSRLQQDRHWTYVRRGYPWSYLEKQQDQDIYVQAFPPGVDTLRPAAVPNKAADLCNKYVETLMVDPPRPSPKATSDSEVAERATEMAYQFLTQDAQESGTDDNALFWYSTDAATVRASAFHHYWVDPQAGGSTPAQIKAHPKAVDPSNPLEYVNPATGMPEPTTDYVLRYVTEPSDEHPQGEFTDDPSQAARQWLPKIKVDMWGREHIRIFPEDKDIANCDQVVGLYYCTLSEAKRRWASVRDLDANHQAELLDWTPPRFLVLLPPALRARWKLGTGDEMKQGGSNDQRMMFWYVWYQKPCPDYPEGAMMYVTGAYGGFVLGRETLTAQIDMPTGGTDIRTLDIPVVQNRLIQDPDDRDPTGRPLIERFGAASEARATLFMSYLEAMDLTLHPAMFVPATSPLQAHDIQESRSLGKPVAVLSRDDYPHYEDRPPIPGDILNVLQWDDIQMDSSASLNKPAQGASDQQEVSGVARNIAVRQALVAMSRSQQALNAAYARHWRLKCQLAMKYFTVPQMIRYVGDDGAYKQEWWTGKDFAHIEDVSVQAGTGTMMPPQEKVNYAATLQHLGFIGADEASDAARPAFSESLGLDVDPQQQRVERQVSSWLEGPPKGNGPGTDWLSQFKHYEQAQQQYQQMQQQAQMQFQQAQAQFQQMQQQAQQMGQPVTAQPPQPPQLPPAPVAPWTPFGALPMDDEPEIANVRKRRLRRLMATTSFTAQPVEWQGMVVNEYRRMRQALALASQAAQQAQIQADEAKHGKTPQPAPQPSRPAAPAAG